MKSVFLLIFLAVGTASVTAFTAPAQKMKTDLLGDEGIIQENYTVADGIDYATRSWRTRGICPNSTTSLRGLSLLRIPTNTW